MKTLKPRKEFFPAMLNLLKRIDNYEQNISKTILNRFKPKDKNELKQAVKLYCTDKQLAINTYGIIDNWDTSNITDMSWLCTNTTFNEDISQWDTSNVTDMSWMFCDCRLFNQPLNDWDVSSVKDMGMMFYGCSRFNQPLDNWDTSNVKDMDFMFLSTFNFDSDLSNWDVSNLMSSKYALNRKMKEEYKPRFKD